MEPEIFILDIDGTILSYGEGFSHSTWAALGEHAEINHEKWEQYEKKYSQFPELYTEWHQKNAEVLRGVSVSPIMDKILPPPYLKGFGDFCKFIKSRSKLVGIVSGGVDLVANAIAQEHSLDFVVANHLEVKNGIFTGNYAVNVHITGKGDVVKSILNSYDIAPEKAVMVGNSFNDVPAWNAVGHPFGLNLDKPEYKQYVKADFPDFIGLLEYLTRN